MQITINKAELVSSVQTALRAVPARPTMPIVGTIKFEALDNNTLVITGTDLDTAIQCTVPAVVNSPGQAAIPAKYLADLAKRLPDGPVEIKVDSQIATIKYGKSKAAINCFPPDQYPSIAKLSAGKAITLKNFGTLLRQVLFAVGTEQERPIFTGVLFELEDGNRINIVATDTHRLVVKTIEAQVPDKFRLLIPGKTCNEVLKIAGNEIIMQYEESIVQFTAGNTTISTRTIAGNFPPYRQVIPVEFTGNVTVNTRELLESTERVSLFNPPENKIPVVKMEPAKGKLSIRSNSGWIDETIEVKSAGEVPESIFFNGSYLSEALEALNSETVVIHFTGPMSAAILKDPQSEDYISLLLPAKPYEKSEEAA